MTAATLPALADLAGRCACGCGQQTVVAAKTDRRSGAVRGEPRRYVHGHNGAVAATSRHTWKPRARYRAKPAPGPWRLICATCPFPLVPSNTRRVPRGWRRNAGRGLCPACYTAADRAGTLLDHPRTSLTRDEVLDEWDALREQGYRRRSAAARLGLSLDGLDAHLYRGRDAGDPRAQWAPP